MFTCDNRLEALIGGHRCGEYSARLAISSR
jgi:hypothetical protein